jgi:CheY-like chemotaxis protein
VIAPYAGDCGVVAVNSPSEVPARAAEYLPSALVLDRMMLADEAVQSMLSRLPYDMPVISLAFPGNPGRARGLPEGAADYLVKPVRRQDLIRSVRSLGPDIRKLLVVDDDPGMIRFVTMVFQSGRGSDPTCNEVELMSASTGKQALDTMRGAPPGAVLLDLALPDISGWQVLETMQESDELSRIPVVLVTAHDLPQEVSAGEQTALQVTMRRPLFRRELGPVLQSLLRTIRPTYPAEPARPAVPAV